MQCQFSCPSITCDPFEDWAILKSKHSVFLCTFQTKTLSACSDLVACAPAFHISRWQFCRSTGVMFWHGNVWHKAILSTEIHQTLFTSLGHVKYFNFVTFKSWYFKTVWQVLITSHTLIIFNFLEKLLNVKAFLLILLFQQISQKSACICKNVSHNYTFYTCKVKVVSLPDFRPSSLPNLTIERWEVRGRWTSTPAWFPPQQPTFYDQSRSSRLRVNLNTRRASSPE